MQVAGESRPLFASQLCITLLPMSSLYAPLSLSPCNLLLPQFLASSHCWWQSSVLTQCKEWVFFLICMHLFGSGDVIVLGLSADGGFLSWKFAATFSSRQLEYTRVQFSLPHLAFPLPSYRHLIRICLSDWKREWNSDWHDWTAVGYDNPSPPVLHMCSCSALPPSLLFPPIGDV